MATIVLNHNAHPTPNRVRGRGVNYKALAAEQMELDHEDADAPGENEYEDSEMNEDADAEGEIEEPELGSDADADGEVEEETDEGEFVGAVKTRSSRARSRRVPEEEEEEESEAYEGNADNESDSASSAAQGSWQAVDDAEEDDDSKLQNVDANRCM